MAVVLITIFGFSSCAFFAILFGLEEPTEFVEAIIAANFIPETMTLLILAVGMAIMTAVSIKMLIKAGNE